MIVVTPRAQVASLTSASIIQRRLFESLLLGQGGSGRVHRLRLEVKVIASVAHCELFVFCSALLWRSEIELCGSHD